MPRSERARRRLYRRGPWDDGRVIGRPPRHSVSGCEMPRSPAERHVAYTRFTFTRSHRSIGFPSLHSIKDYAGDDALFVTASDRGNTGRGGSQQMSLEVPLFVDASCDAPVIKPIQKVVVATTRTTACPSASRFLTRTTRTYKSSIVLINSASTISMRMDTRSTDNKDAAT